MAGVGFDTATYTSATISPIQANAERLVYGKLNGYVQVALFSTTVPALIAEMTADVTALKVCTVILGFDHYRLPDIIKERAKEFDNFITGIRTGEIYLGSTYAIDYNSKIIGTTASVFNFDDTSVTSWFDIDNW